MEANLVYIILSPTIGALLLGFLYLVSKKITIPKNVFTFIGILTPLISFIFSLLVFLHLHETSRALIFQGYKWVEVGNFAIHMSFLADNLSSFMILFITFVGWLIHIYATGYMSDDEGYGKFFFYFNLFLASMLLLVLGNSPIIMFIGWEGVGVCSYLLISYYYKDNENVVSGNKAFIANRIGDAGFIMGMSVLFFYAGQSGFDYHSLALNASSMPHEIKVFVGITLFVGAMAKSAQIPLYVWLPDAMTGPTPVSALIHAATMVTAGVYMVARFCFLYNDIPNVGLFIAYIGAFSSIFAAIIALKQTDIKKILAYSTMSQLGYMFIAVGLGSYGVGIFHVFTHAFFKAALFMGAGAVIVALHHEQNIFKMGGMRKATPLIYISFIFATLAISGIPPFSGFFSKDEILLVAFSKGEYFIWTIGVITALMTAFYMFRLFFVTFHGENKNRSKTHKVSFKMSIPVFVLGVGAIGVGWIGIPKVLGGSNVIHHFLGEGNLKLPEISHSLELVLMGVNTLIALLGIFFAYKKYGNYDYSKEESKIGIIYNKFYIDEIYDFVFVKPLRKISSIISDFIDNFIIDGAIMNTCKELVKAGWGISILQNANIRAYVFAMMIGVSAISFYLLTVIG